MSNAALFVLSVLFAGVAAAVLHEATHYSVAVLGGREAWVEWHELNEYHYYPPDGPGLVDRLVGIAPFAIGSVLAVVWLAAGMRITIPLLVAWGVYTLNGIPNDFRV